MPVASALVPAGGASPVLPVPLPAPATVAMVVSNVMLVGAILLLLSAFCCRAGSKVALDEVNRFALDAVALDAVNSFTKLS